LFTSFLVSNLASFVPSFLVTKFPWKQGFGQFLQENLFADT
jgi:hypothetical protein